jgi:uncharacterized protein YjbJ (UPF0337 family)
MTDGELNRDQVAGQTDQAAGEVKETVGAATGDHRLEREGLEEQIAGKAQENDGDKKEVVGELASDASTQTLRDAVNKD